MKWFILLMMMSGSAQAGVFKCVNAEGKKTYQSSPCEEDEKVDSYKFREESAATKESRARDKKEGYADKLRKKYKAYQVGVAKARAQQRVNNNNLTVGRSAMNSYGNKITAKYLSEMELIKLEAKDKGIKLY